MPDTVTNELLLEHLKSIQSKLSGLSSDMADLKADMRSLKGHMASFMQAEVAQDGSIASMQARLDRIEQRLSLADG